MLLPKLQSSFLDASYMQMQLKGFMPQALKCKMKTRNHHPYEEKFPSGYNSYPTS